MRSLFVFLAVLLIVSPAFGEAILTIEGPAEPLAFGPGKFKVDIYGEGISDFTAIQAVIQFRDAGDVLSDDFEISESNGNPAFENQAIWPNEIEFPLVFPIYVDDAGNSFHRQIAGFMLLAGSSGLTDKTLIQTIWYDYTANASGSYTISFDSGETVLSDSLGSAIDYEMVSSSVIIPEPSTHVLLGIGIIFLLVYFRREILYPFL